MSSHKAVRKSYQAVLADVKKEMALPRVAKSAHIEDPNASPPAFDTPPKTASSIASSTAPRHARR